jgi:isoleucyl-tRNA synthetase
MDYKNTLLLPKTDFPMRAELPKREPAFLAKWREEKVYDQIMAARAGGEKFVLHDGPPFANGDAHMGHALNMVLKDIVLKYQNMSGHYAPFVPGWDCHGLPIEHKVMKELGANETDPIKIREKCEATARHFVGVQSEQFQRLGVFGDWANPYLTLDPAYEAETIRVFATLVEKGLVYQGLRPVLWSTGCQTALAEAEIEYKEKVDPAIYVKFPLTDDRQNQFGVNGVPLRNVSLLIWTTTPWTLPANLAVAVSTQLNYVLVELSDGSAIIVLAQNKDTSVEGIQREGFQLPKGLKFPEGVTITGYSGPFKGSDLVGKTYKHPFLDDGKKREVFAADFVTADAGTGLVHIAPGHGQDDYQLGMQHGLPAFSPVDDRGCLTEAAGVPAITGQYVFKANPSIIGILKENNLLFAEESYTHDYPYCWRSKTPIVYRAVKQWFIKVDAFRADALAAIDGVKWIPESGRNRIRGAVETRPDWCISRQRTWGIPLPVFYDGDEPVLSEKVIRKFADLVEKEGAGIWFARSADELAPALDLPLGLRKGNDTLDVWIDSGTSWAAVVAKRPELKGTPADLYLEGSDQHRGWFQSSLLTSVAATGAAPYRAVLTNGFVVDQDRKKLSKSNEGYQKPVDLMSLVNEHGADVLRLWVASQDYQNDIPFSTDILARVADTYRSIRNTLRILLGNLADFDPAKDSVSWQDLTELDKCLLVRFGETGRLVLQSYETYEFSQVYQTINRFCAVDLSSLYVDVLKDRLYCNSKSDLNRRSAQAAMTIILSGLVKLLAPIIPYTSEEAWFAAGQPDSVHSQRFPLVRGPGIGEEEYLLSRWEHRLALRSRVNEKLEEARREKKIGKSLEGHIEIATRNRDLVGGSVTTADLEELFIVSKVVLKPTDGEETITVTRAEEHGMKKCIRCWKYWDHVGSHAEHPELCERCTKVVLNWQG